MHRALCLTVTKLRRKSVDNFADLLAGAHGLLAKFSTGGGRAGAKGRRNGSPRAQFFYFLMYIRKKNANDDIQI
jgi:hypothetical protein